MIASKKQNNIQNSKQTNKQTINSLSVKFDQLQQTNDDFEQCSKRNSLRISGLYEFVDEKLCMMLYGLFNKRNLQKNVITSDNDRVHHVSCNGSTKAILVKFTSYQARHNVKKDRASLKHATSHELMALINENVIIKTKLPFKTRQLNKKGHLSNCWSYDDKILFKDFKG